MAKRKMTRVQRNRRGRAVLWDIRWYLWRQKKKYKDKESGRK